MSKKPNEQDPLRTAAVAAPKLASLAALVAVVVGAVVLVGWAFDIAVLKSILPGWISMKPNTAVCFILAGIALWLTTRQSAIRNPQSAILFFRLARFCALLVGLIGLLTLGEYVFGWNLGIDQWLIREPVGTVNTSFPGRMTAETAVDFILLSVALWLTGSSRQTRRSTRAARWSIIAAVISGLLVTILALAVILSYLTLGLGENGWFGFAIMALHTAILFAILGVAVIAINWQQQDVLQWSLSKYTTVAFACGMALLVFVGLNTSRSQFWMSETNRQIAHTERMLADADNVLTGIIDAQVHSRDYLITGDEQHLKHYLSAKADSNTKLDELYQTEFASGEPEHQQHFTRIEAQVKAQLQWLQQIIDARQTGMNEATLSNMLNHGEDLLDNFRSTLDQAESEDRQIIEQLKRESKSVARFSYISIFMGTLAGLLIFLGVIFRLNSAMNERKRSEKALQESEARYALTIASAELATWDWNIKTGHDIFNERWAEMRGYRLEEIEPHVSSWEKGVNPDDLSAMSATLEEHFKGRTPFFQTEYRVSTKSGSIIWILDRGMVLERDADGSPLRMAGIEIDITERKNSENKLAESERHFRAVTESANDAIITGAGAGAGTGSIVGWNAAAERVFGYTETEIIGQPITVLMPERFRNLHSAGLARVVAGGTPHVIGKTVELAGLRKDGSEFPLEFSLAQWQAAEGQFFTAIIRDITERKRAEDSLRKLSLAVEQSPNSIVITDLDANIEYANAAFVKATGYSLAEAIGQNPRLLHSGKTPRATYDDLWAHLTRGELWKGEFINRRKDGSEYIESVLISPVRGDDGRVTNYLAIKEDITEHKRIESDLGVNRTELEMQNEELRRAQIALEESRDQFVDLYEFSPVGYLTLNHEEMIDKINLTATTLLGVERNKLLHHRFVPFVATEDRDRWHRHFLNVLQHDGQQRCELALRRSDDSVCHAQLDCLHINAGGTSSVRVALTDITERKQAEDKQTEQFEELRRWHEATSGREGRILILKHEVNELLEKSGQAPRYPSAET